MITRKITFLAACLEIAMHDAPAAPRVDDTALTLCFVGGGYTTECADSGQDAAYGADSGKTSDKNGVSGFNFVKIDAAGAELPSAAQTWECVKDRRTDLTWEVKSKTPGLRFEGNLYSHRIGARDVRRFADSVNEAGLCGSHDWRPPSRDEADTLISFRIDANATVQGIDRTFFPDTSNGEWTNTCMPLQDDCAITAYKTGDYQTVLRGDLAPARLVRGRKFVSGAGRYSSIGGEATDRRTGLVWRRCSEGEVWDATTCKQNAQRYDWDGALALARAEAIRTGVAWRLPSVKELMSINALPAENPSIDGTVFPKTPNERYWTSSIGPHQLPWFVATNSGNQLILYPPSQRFYVRLVRDAK